MGQLLAAPAGIFHYPRFDLRERTCKNHAAELVLDPVHLFYRLFANRTCRDAEGVRR